MPLNAWTYLVMSRDDCRTGLDPEQQYLGNWLYSPWRADVLASRALPEWSVLSACAICVARLIKSGPLSIVRPDGNVKSNL